MVGQSGLLGGDVRQGQPVQGLAGGELRIALRGLGLDGELGGRLRGVDRVEPVHERVLAAGRRVPAHQAGVLEALGGRQLLELLDRQVAQVAGRPGLQALLSLGRQLRRPPFVDERRLRLEHSCSRLAEALEVLHAGQLGHGLGVCLAGGGDRRGLRCRDWRRGGRLGRGHG